MSDSESSSQSPKKPFYKKWWFILFGVIVVLGAISRGGDDDGGSSGNSSTPDAVTINRPEMEAKFIEVATQAIKDGRGADNDMQRGGLLSKRNEEICSLFPSYQRSVKDWTGYVALVDSNSDGKGVLSVKLARNIHVRTWNNSFSDLDSHTLLEPNSNLFKTASSLGKGDKVKFSGTFFSDSEGACLAEQSMSLNGKLSDPEFTFRFTSLSKLSTQDATEGS